MTDQPFIPLVIGNKKALDVGAKLRVGQVWINSFGVRLDVEFPFGGYKLSGFGREKGLEALAAYRQVRNIAIHHPLPVSRTHAQCLNDDY